MYHMQNKMPIFHSPQPNCSSPFLQMTIPSLKLLRLKSYSHLYFIPSQLCAKPLTNPISYLKNIPRTQSLLSATILVQATAVFSLNLCTSPWAGPLSSPGRSSSQQQECNPYSGLPVANGSYTHWLLSPIWRHPFSVPAALGTGLLSLE